MGDLSVKVTIEHGPKKKHLRISDKADGSGITYLCTRCGNHTMPGTALCSKCIKRDQLYNANRI